jgi:hypothetical protein
VKIISPVDNLAETPRLLEAGADELYGGFVPPEWQESYDLLASINQRTFAAAQIDTEAELAEIVQLTHAAGRQFALTLNAPCYSDAQLPLLRGCYPGVELHTRTGMALAGEIDDPAVYRRRAMAAHRARFGADCHSNICYYPELMSQDPWGEE